MMTLSPCTRNWIILLLCLAVLVSACGAERGDATGQVSIIEVTATATPNAQPVQVVPIRTLVPVATATATPDVLPGAPSFTPLPTRTPVPEVVRDGISGTANQIYVRVGPSTMSTVMAVINDLAPIQPIGRTADNRWLQLRLADNRSGWIMTMAIVISDDLDALPVTGEPNNVANVALVPAERSSGLTLHRSPNGIVAASLEPLTPLRIDGRTATGDWLLVSTNDASQGWVRSDRLPLTFPLSAVEVAEVDTVVRPVQLENANARVRSDAGGLRLRQLPNPDAPILFNLSAGAPLQVSQRTTDSAWVYVSIPEGFEGWTAAQYVEMDVDLAAIPVNDNPQPPPSLNTVVEDAPVAEPLAGARAIYLRGQERGNRRNVFSLVGDNLTDTEHFMRGFAGSYNLRGYDYLQPTVQLFNIDTGYGNTFAREPFSAGIDWLSYSALDTSKAPDHCESGETPLDCEYRLVRPSVALIMIGTYDAPWRPVNDYRNDLRRIVDTTINHGVIPVLSTIPIRRGSEDNVNAYNQAIRQLAAEYDIPLWDFNAAIANLPDSGLHGDGVQLSVPPGSTPATVDFTDANLQFGTTVRNLTALQMLHTVLEQVMY